LRFVEFPHPETTPVSGLNTVELKRLDLARALASRPKLLLLDELAAGLMTGQLGALEDILRKIRDSGVTIIMVEHVIRTIFGLCDRLAVLRQGEKIADGPTKEVASDPAVIEAYLGERH
jgi:branched-chain amino acid transport system ATP-binding protein